jgi:protein gp37
MSARTGIQWTDATFNPWWGCTKISPGCDHCYAEEIARRFHPDSWGADGARRVFESKHFREPLGWNRKAELAGKPLRVFSGSMCDVFEKHPVAEEYRPELFTLIHKTPWLRWQLLTKRIGNVARMVPPSWMNGHWPRNAWIGATIVDRVEMLRDGPKIVALPAPVTFWSVEPMLADLCVIPSELFPKWVICGGESGNKARAMNPQWARNLRDQCAAAGVPFFFKQWGEFSPDAYGECERVGGAWMKRVGKKAAGRLLDGIEHNNFPELRA